MNFEGITYNILLQRMLDKVPSDIDKREGSIIYDAIAPCAMELMSMYLELKRVIDESFADTASREYLIKRASERGLVPYPATYAILKGIFNIDIPLNTRFSQDKLNYFVLDKISDFEYRMQCETVGSSGNRNFGQLIPIDYIDGLTNAELTELLIPAEDEEDTEDFRDRYFASFDVQAFGGNRADYIQKTNTIIGIGGVKVYPTWNGGGTVKLVVIDSDFNSPSVELLAYAQNEVDPIVGGGTGIGFAPIGHVVTVVGVQNITINIASSMQFTNGYDFDTALPSIREELNAYLFELREIWQNENSLIVRTSQIESRLLNLPAILDIQDTFINGVDTNFVVSADFIPVLGEVTNNG